MMNIPFLTEGFIALIFGADKLVIGASKHPILHQKLESLIL